MTFPDYPLRQAASRMLGQTWWLRSLFTSGSIKRQAHEYLSAHQGNLFFVLGSGRSGTQLIADLMNASGHAVVFHEPNFRSDVATMDEFRRNPQGAVNYWREFRSVEVFKRWKSAGGAALYGEVNGTIRYHAPAIKELFPAAQLFLICRDGRGVVRSIMGWPQFYGPGSQGAYALAPLDGDPYREKWSGMSRFEKVCWSWRETNEFVMQNIESSRWLQIEKLADDFDYFSERFARRLGIDYPRELWREHTSRKSRNASQEYGFPAWENWSREQRDAFARICGDTMTKLGYSL